MLVLRSNGVPVRPHVGAQASLGRVRSGRSQPGAKLAAQPAAAGPPQTATPAYLEQAYDLSYLSQTGGSSDTVAIVDAYDDPTADADLAVYRSTYGLPACTSQSGCFKKVNENGATSPLPAADASWDVEISLDLDAVSAVCPHCHILLVEAASPYDTDLDAAVQTAAAMGANQISASWTFTDNVIPSGSYTFPGIATVAATGDEGYVGPGADDYPAAFPGVTAAGGTTLTPASSAGARGFSEGAWSGGGSGCDLNFDQPSYQPDAGCAGRAYADLSADANPSTGLNVYDNGSWGLIGGTSLSTPLIAAYYAITGVAAATPQWAYTDSSQLNDVVSGSTGNCTAGISYICDAGVGYDGPTGVGSISGAAATGAPGIGGPSIGSGSANTNTYTQSAGSHGATIAGGIYQNSLNTTWWIQYGTSSAYGSQTAAADLGAGSAPVAVTGYLSGLAPATTYHYRLVAENSLGTTYGYDYTFTTASAPDSAPTASFSASPSTTFPGGSVTFDASGSTGGSGPAITDYQWNFGDGTPVDDVGAGATVQHTYTSRGVHTVTLTVTNGEGSDSTTQTVTVDDPPTAAFTPSASVAAPGATVSFDASASGPGDPGGTITDYSWNFGDGTPVDDTGESADASHAFASPGIYPVALTTTDDLGVSTTSTQQVTIDAPAAAFTISPATVVAPGTAVSFDATGSTDPKGTITDYSWSFGDGTPVDDAGTSTSVQRAYASRGTYTVTLTVTNNFGQTNTSTHTITVDDPPTAAFTSSPATVAAPGATVNFDATASAPGASGGTITDYSWNFGDGTPVDDTSGTAAASHAYASPGIYTVTLTATDDLGVTGTATEQLTVDAPTAAFTPSATVSAPGATVSFDASGSTDPEGTITDYSWNLGRGRIVDTGSTPSLQFRSWHRGARTITLTVTNNYGQTSTATHTLTIDDPPTAAFTPSASVAAPGATVNFNASASAPGASGGTITDYSWNFGDGTPVDDTGATAAASHAYAAPGTYTVTLTTTDDLGVTDTATEQVTVDAPAAAFTIAPSTPAPGSSVSFDASSSTDPEGTISDYSWNFGDGTPVQDAGGSAGVQHTFASRGTYTVALTVTNNSGQTNTSTHTVTVDDPPTASFAPSATVVAPGATVNFEASASAPGGPDGTITSYTWNFGDGSAVAAGGGSADASHTFESPGTYTVTLTTTDDLGVSTTTTEQITVSAPPPPVGITVTPTPPIPTPTPPPSTGPTPTTPQPLTAALAAAKKQRLAAATAHGLRIQLSTNASSTVSFQITIPRSETRQGMGASASLKRTSKPVVLLQTGGRSFPGGTYSITLKLSKAAVRELSGAGPLRVTIRITVLGANGAKLTRSATVTLQR